MHLLDPILLWKPNVLQAVLIASRRSLIQRKGVLDTTHEIIERLEAHLRAVGQFTVQNIIFHSPTCFLSAFRLYVVSDTFHGRWLQT